MSQGYTSGVPKVNDPTLSGNSQFLVPTEYAVKTYVDAAIGAIPPSVESVTDDGNGAVTVDNTDPLNPVIGFAAQVDGLTIDGDGTTANPLEAKFATLSVQPTIVTHTGTNAETILYSYMIPAGTIGNNDMLRVQAMFRKNSGSGQLQGRVRLHTSNAVGGTIIGFSTLSAANNTMRFMCDQVWQNTNNATIGWPSGSGSFATNWGTSYVTTALNNAADIWVIVTAQLVTSTDTSELSFARVELFKYP